MKANDWTKISNTLADSTDWEFISSKIKLSLKLDIAPAFSMFVWEEYLKLAHKKNNPCVKGAEFESRTFNTRNLFLETRNLDYETFDKLIKFINKQFIELGKLNSKLQIVKFNDYYDTTDFVENKNSTTFNNFSTSVNKNSTSNSTKIQQPVNNFSTTKKIVEKLRQHYYFLKRKNADNAAILQAKTQWEDAKKTVVENSTIQQFNNNSTTVNKNSTVVNNFSTSNSTTFNGGTIGGYISANILEKEREKECVEKEVVENSTSDFQQLSEKFNNTPPSFSTNFQQNSTSEVVENSRVPLKNPYNNEKKAKIEFNSREFMNGFYKLEKNLKTFNVDKFLVFNDVKKMEYCNDNFLKYLLLYVQPIKSLDFDKIKKRFDVIFELLDQNTSVPIQFNNLNEKEKLDKKQNLLNELKNEALENNSCSLRTLFTFLLNYFGKKKDNGFNKDLPTYIELQDYIKDQEDINGIYCDRIVKSIERINNKIAELNKQKSQLEVDDVFGEYCDNSCVF